MISSLFDLADGDCVREYARACAEFHKRVRPAEVIEQMNLPTQARLIQLFDSFLEDFGFERYKDVQWGTDTRNMNIYRNAFKNANIFGCVGYLLRRAEYLNWCYGDFLSPKIPTIIHILSRLTAIHKSLLEKEQLLKELEPEYRGIRETIKKQEMEIEEIKEKIEEATIRLNEKKQLTEATQEFFEKFAHTKKRNEILKEQKSEIIVRIKEMEEILHTKDESIIDSPQKIYEAVTEKESKVYARRGERQELDRQRMQFLSVYNRLVDLMHRLRKYKPIFEEIFQKADQLDGMCLNASELRDSYDDNKRILESVRNKKERFENKKKEVEKELAHLVKNHKKQYTALENKIIETENQLKVEEEERTRREKAAHEEREILTEKLEELRLMREHRRKDFEEFKEMFTRKISEIQAPIRERKDKLAALTQT